MADWLARNGHGVEVFAIEQLTAPTFRVETSVQDGLTVHRLYYNIEEGNGGFQNSYDNPQIENALCDILNRGHFDLLHIISGYLLGASAVRAGHRSGVPVAISLMEYWFICPQINLIQPTGRLCSGPESDEKCTRCMLEEKRRYRLPAQMTPTVMDVLWRVGIHLPFTQETTRAITHRRTLLQDTLNDADLVICNSRFIIDKFAEFGFDTSRYVYIRQGLTTHGQALTRKPGNGTLRLGYVGQVKPHKGVDLLVEAACNLMDTGQPVTLDIWGATHEAAEYVALLKERGARYPAIRWKGRYVGSQVWDVLASMDVLVVPSRWYENSPNVILEAFKAGLPVIVTQLGGMAELVENGKGGLSFELNNVSDLSRQIKRLLDDPDLIERLRAAIPPVKTLDDEMNEVVAQYNRLLEQAH
jgi:glycosyltransferase involved in cell wall biosynthesis